MQRIVFLRRSTWLWPLMPLAILLAAWHLAVAWTQTRVFPAPAQVLLGLEELLRKGLLAGYVKDSLARVAAGYLTAIAIGIPVGLLLGSYPLAARACNPVIQMMRPISPLAWTPVAIVWFGIGNKAPVFLIFLASLFPIIVATANGVRNVSP